jgi:hypothetical protein
MCVLREGVRYDRHVGLLARILGRAAGRDRGLLAEEEPESKTPRPPRPAPTPGTRPPKYPPPTPTTRPLGDPGTTAGTRGFRGQGGTPSTQRIHNPTHIGR